MTLGFAKKLLSIGALAVLSAQSSASLILETYGSGVATPTTLGGYEMTDFDFINTGLGSSVSSVASPIDGDITFQNYYGNDLGMTIRADSDVDWWNRSTDEDPYNIYTTGVNWIELILPENTRAFSFNVGADLRSRSNNAWLKAYEDSNLAIGKTWFNVSQNNTPGFGIYTDNSDGSCSSISSVIIDPEFWGVGNFSINQDACTTSVPEPSSVGLLGIGLLGLGIMRRRLA